MLGPVDDSKSTPYERLGGAEAVRELVDRFYDYMDTLPEAREIRAMHPDDLSESRDKLAMFLTGWLGGPPIYMEKRGHPRLRMRHFPFAIDNSARDAWMECMNRAINDCVGDALLREMLGSAFTRMATHLRNVDEDPRQPGR